MLWPLDQWLLRSCHHSFGVSERLLQSLSAASYPFTWPLLSLWAPLTAGCHNQQQLDDKSLGFRSMQALHKHISATSAYDASGSWRHAPTFFFLAHSAPSSPVCLSHSYSLSGFFSLFLWSLESGMSRSFIWRGTSCGPESLWRQLPPVIQRIISSAVAPMFPVSGILGTRGSINQYKKEYDHIKWKIVNARW